MHAELSVRLSGVKQHVPRIGNARKIVAKYLPKARVVITRTNADRIDCLSTNQVRSRCQIGRGVFYQRPNPPVGPSSSYEVAGWMVGKPRHVNSSTDLAGAFADRLFKSSLERMAGRPSCWI